MRCCRSALSSRRPSMRSMWRPSSRLSSSCDDCSSSTKLMSWRLRRLRTRGPSTGWGRAGGEAASSCRRRSQSTWRHRRSGGRLERSGGWCRTKRAAARAATTPPRRTGSDPGSRGCLCLGPRGEFRAERRDDDGRLLLPYRVTCLGRPCSNFASRDPPAGLSPAAFPGALGAAAPRPRPRSPTAPWGAPRCPGQVGGDRPRGEQALRPDVRRQRRDGGGGVGRGHIVGCGGAARPREEA